MVSFRGLQGFPLEDPRSHGQGILKMLALLAVSLSNHLRGFLCDKDREGIIPLCLLFLRNDPLFQITIPSKTQAYMAIGRPILMGVRGNAADLITKAKCGLVCEPENPQSIAAAVHKFYAMPKAELDAMGESGKRFYENELSIDIGTRKYEKIFESVVKQSRKPN